MSAPTNLLEHGAARSASARVPMLVAAALYLAQLPLYFGYLTDDTYIYARFAQNLARSHELAFNPGVPVHAATSPLWAALGALGAALGVSPFWTLKALGWLAGLVAVLLLARCAARLLGARPWTLVCAAVIGTEPWLIRWSGSGMETPLAVLLLAAAMDAALRPARAVRWTQLGCALGIAPLVRPECTLLLVLTALWAVGDAEARRRGRFWAGLLLPLLLWVPWAMAQFGHVWPLTMRAKSTPLGLQPARLAANAWVLCKLLASAGAIPCACALLALRRLPRARAVRAESWLEPVLLAWIVLLPLVYLARDVQVVSRYLEIVLPAIVVLGGVAAQRIASVAGGGRGWGRGVALLWVAQAAVGLALTVGVIAPSARSFSISWAQGLGSIADWLRANTPPSTEVAIYDIGYLGYRSQRRILDLGGLVDPRMERLRDQVDDREIVRRGLFLQLGAPNYLVDWSTAADELDGQLLGDRRAVAILHQTVANRGLSRPVPAVYTLYRLEPRP